MGMAKKVRMLLAEKGMSVAELSRKIKPETSSQNSSGKLKRDNLTEQDLRQIAGTCGATFEEYFILEDGTKI